MACSKFLLNRRVVKTWPCMEIAGSRKQLLLPPPPHDHHICDSALGFRKCAARVRIHSLRLRRPVWCRASCESKIYPVMGWALVFKGENWQSRKPFTMFLFFIRLRKREKETTWKTLISHRYIPALPPATKLRHWRHIDLRLKLMIDDDDDTLVSDQARGAFYTFFFLLN